MSKKVGISEDIGNRSCHIRSIDPEAFAMCLVPIIGVVMFLKIKVHYFSISVFLNTSLNVC